MAALDAFHARYADTALALEVTRHPYSFRGGERESDGSWRWRDGLGVIGGDMVCKALREQFRVSEADVAAFRAVGGLRRAVAEASPLVQYFLMICQGYGKPTSLEKIKVALAEFEAAPPTVARGRPVGDLDRLCAEGACAGLAALGDGVGIPFDFDVMFRWHPVDSQRMIFYAARRGKQEPYMTAMAKRHFERREAAGDRATILSAAAEVGLDVGEAAAFLDTDEYEAETWRSYGDTIGKYGINAIPYFVFNGPATNGGVFRDGEGKGETVVRGSASSAEFLDIFERLRRAAPPPPPTVSEVRGMGIKALKQALRDRRVSAAGCSEKSDLVDLLLQHI